MRPEKHKDLSQLNSSIHHRLDKVNVQRLPKTFGKPFAKAKRCGACRVQEMAKMLIFPALSNQKRKERLLNAMKYQLKQRRKAQRKIRKMTINETVQSVLEWFEIENCIKEGDSEGVMIAVRKFDAMANNDRKYNELARIRFMIERDRLYEIANNM